MSLLLPDAGLLFWMVLSFGVVFIILAKWGFPVIVKMVNDRKEYIDSSLKVAEEANRQLANIKAEGEAVLTEARQQQMKILAEATDAKNRILAEAKQSAQDETLKQMEEVKRQIRIEKEAAIAEVRTQIAMISVEVAEKVIREKIEGDKAQMALIDRMLDEIETRKS